MRNFLPLLVIIALGVSGFAQQRVMLNKELRDVAVEKVYHSSLDQPLNLSKEMNVSPGNRAVAFDEFQIGTSWFDLQTNSLTQNRMVVFDDGTMAAVWTLGIQSPPAFPDRGTGYNYFDGSAWGPQPTTRIETDRTGWPSLAPFGEDGEIVCAHISGGAGEGLIFSKRDTKGSGAWEEFFFQGPAGWENVLWPRMVTSGATHNEIHVIVLTAPTGNGGSPYNGQDGAMLYSRSTDGGANWDIVNQSFDHLDADNYTAIRGDNYMWAELRANTLAFMIADPWMDLVLMKSSNNGDSWEKTVVWEHPYPFFDWNVTVTDTFYCPDNSGGLALDDDGMAHIVFGIGRVAHFEVGNTYTFWPYTDGIAYWNETMPSFSANHHALDPWGHPQSELTVDYNLVGWMQDVDNNGTIDILPEMMSYRELGMSTMPEIVIHDNIANLIYASTTEGYENGVYNFKHLWVRTKIGSNWENLFTDLNTDLVHIFDECIFPHTAPVMTMEGFELNTHLFYNIDSEPGLAWSEDHVWQENKMVYLKYPIFYEGISDPQGNTIHLEIEKVYPNPAAMNVYLDVRLSETLPVKACIIDLTGQVMREKDFGMIKKGNAHLQMSVKQVPQGIYFLNLKAGQASLTRKLIVQGEE
ncbi:MAG: T9SS type A sorting domain-containing protein [Bacteroidales bacterium]|nr:T9SS type A sorting domain-containing protein [Bacteroidales bacterium]